MKISISTEPQNIFKVIKTSFLIWKHSLIKTIPFSLIFIVVHEMVAPVFLDLSDKISDYKWEQFSLNLIFSKNYLLLGSKIVLYSIVFSIINISIIYILNKIANNEKVYCSQAMKTGFNKAFSQLLTYILFMMLVMAIMLFMIFLLTFPINTFLHLKFAPYLYCILACTPSVIIFVYFMFAPYLLIIEENSIVDSMKDSFKLVLGNWWYTFGACVILGIVSQAYLFMFDNFSVKGIIQRSFSTMFIAPFHGAFIIAILYNLLAKNRCRCKLEVNAVPLEHSGTGNATRDWIF